MKSIYLFLSLAFLPIGVSLAQTQPQSKAQSTTSPTSTTLSSNTATTGSTNRMQDLYDEHHGITRKSATSTSVPVRTDTPRQTSTSPVTETNSSVVQPEREASAANMSGTRIGVRGGITYPVFLESQTLIDPAIGFVGGITFNFGAGHVSFQPEINYARHAQKVTTFGFSSTQAVDQLEIPLFVKFSTGTYAGNRFFVNVGPYGSYKMNISENGKTTSLDGTKGRLGFGGALGIGAAFKAGPGHVTVEVRGLYPLGDVDAGFNTDSKRIFGQGTLGYVFPLGGRSR